MKTLAPAQRIRRWHTHLVVWAVHRVLGLGIGVLIVVASITGGLLVMHREIERVVEPGRHVIPGSAGVPPASNPIKAGETPALPRLPITTLVRWVTPLAPEGYRTFRLIPGETADASDQVMFVSPDGRTRWSAFINPCSGQILWHGADQSLFTPWVLALHMHLRLGGWGYIATGLGGVGLFLLGATGLHLYRDRLSSLWRRPLRLNRGARLALSDLHQWLGGVSIYFSLMLGATGVIYAVTIAPGQIAAPKPLAAPFDFAQLAPVEPVLAWARERFPGAEIRRVAFPATAQAPATILLLHRDAPVWRKFSRIEFDPVTGAVRAIRDARTATPREKFSAMLAPLHMGFYGSPLVKWLYAIGGFAPAILSVTGTAIWFLRTRKQPAKPATALVAPRLILETATDRSR